MTTNYIVKNANYNNIDLNSIFAAKPQGAAGAKSTGYIVNNANYNNIDLNNIFAIYSGGTGSLQAKSTGYIANNPNYSMQDLNTIFAPLTTVFPTTNQLYTSSITYTNFTMPSGKSSFSFMLCGGGGGGYQTASPDNYGGGGSSAYIYAKNIPYVFSGVSTISSISISIGGAGGSGGTGGTTQVTINYNNGNSITLKAGGGIGAVNATVTPGAAGGTPGTLQNSTTWVSSGNYTAVNGSTGGGKNQNGFASPYTSSGSGASSSTTIKGNPPKGTFTLGSITVNSYGGGTSQAPSGYGAAGASTPSGYKQNNVNVAAQWKTGTQGCCIILLS